MSDEPPPLSAEDQDLVDRWLIEAVGIQPDRRAWAVLIAHLRLAFLQEQRGYHAPNLSVGMTAAREAVTAVMNFLDAHEFAKTEGLGAPLFHIQSAIKDVTDGRPSDFFKPTHKAKTRKSTKAAIVSGFAAKALSELIGAGVEQEAAARQVARAVKYGRLVGFNECTADRVIQWRYRLREGAGKVPQDALASFHAPLPREAGDTPRLRANWLLTSLRKGTGLRHND